MTGRCWLVVFLVGALAAACPAAPAYAFGLPSWQPVTRIANVVDLSPQVSNGAMFVDETSGLATFHLGRPPVSFAPAYVSPGGDEPYMAMSPVRWRGRCSFGDQTLYVLRLAPPTGVTAIDRHGHVRRFASILRPGLESGITFDQVGHFGYRLLVTVTHGITSSLYSIDCHGHVRTLVRTMPKVEGGMEVAPAGFGRFGGHLIAPDEVSGHLYAISPNGAAEPVAPLRLPVGGDVGVESLAFLPPGFARGGSALVADRITPGNRYPGDGAILGLRAAQLWAEDLRPGDLLIVTEGGGHTDAVRCNNTCRAWRVASGPAKAHIEGHVSFVG